MYLFALKSDKARSYSMFFYLEINKFICPQKDPIQSQEDDHTKREQAFLSSTNF
jgi:hypothetical protein